MIGVGIIVVFSGRAGKAERIGRFKKDF